MIFLGYLLFSLPHHQTFWLSSSFTPSIREGQTIGSITLVNQHVKRSIVYGMSASLLDQLQVGSFFGKQGLEKRNNIVLAGHNRLGVFRVLEQVKLGDQIDLEILGQATSYVVVSKKIIFDTERFYFNEQEEAMVTMMTCDRKVGKRILIQAKKR